MERSYEEIKTLELEKVIMCIDFALSNPSKSRQVLNKEFLYLVDDLKRELRYRRQKYSEIEINERMV
jgi:hypothetical protein